MAKTQIFETSRDKKHIQMPKLKDICPKEKSYYRDCTIFLIYKDDDLTYPNVGKIDEELSKVYHKIMIKCYIAKRDTVDIIQNILSSNVDKRESFATLVEELSKLHDTENKKIEDVEIEYHKIEDIYERYKNVLVPACDLYKFCYYWISLCIALDFRVSEGRPTFIRRSLIVKDAIDVIRGYITSEEFGKSWDDVKDRIDPTKMITDIKHIPVKGHEKELHSDRFVHKKGEKIPVRPHVKLRITTE